jgi:UDP-2,3-diacylglucosamine pyrophosphatase LpxH
MSKSLFVISDLHLGGGEGFQMCSPAGRERLVAFIDHVGSQRRRGHEVQLVVNGDIVDFLAEEPFASFTGDDDEARRKLARIIASTAPVWQALRDLIASGCRTTLMLGNHDVELSLPGPRRLLLETLGDGVELVCDNQAFVDGPVLIEHGNRYDKWNVVSHDALRQIRSALSRREVALPYDGPPGSQLVQQVLNPIKARYPWVDLLKPESSGMLPILAVLEPAAMKNALALARLAQETTRSRFDANGVPVDPRQISAELADSAARQDPMIQLARALADMDEPQAVSVLGAAQGLLARLKDAAHASIRDEIYRRLLSALRAYAQQDRKAFDTREEDDVYLRPAQAAARRDFKVVIYGHTHLAKRVALDVGGAVYLNTGTWADLMRVPAAVLGDDDVLARQQLEAFVDDLRHGRLDAWRCQMPSFARVDVDDDGQVSADVFVFESDRKLTRLSEGPLSLLAYAGRT